MNQVGLYPPTFHNLYKWRRSIILYCDVQFVVATQGPLLFSTCVHYDCFLSTDHYKSIQEFTSLDELINLALSIVFVDDTQWYRFYGMPSRSKRVLMNNGTPPVH